MNISPNLAEKRALAKESFKNADWQKACQLFSQVAAATNLSIGEKVMLGLSLVNTDDMNKAEQFLNRQNLENPVHQNLVRRLALTPALKAQDYDKAEALLKVLLSVAPDDGKTLSTMANVLVRSGKRSRAMPFLEKAMALEPDNTTVRNQLLLALIQGDENEKAAALALSNPDCWQSDQRFAQLSVQALTRAGQHDKALAPAEAIIGHDTINQSAAQMAAQLFIDAGKPALAQKACEHAFEKGCEGARIRFLVARAIVEQEGDRDTAIGHLEKAIDQNRDDLLSSLLIGELLMKAGRNRAAIPHFKNAVRISPDSTHARGGLGRALKFARRFEEAADVLKDVANSAPTSDSWKRLAVSALLQAGRKDEARKMFAGHQAQKRSGLPNSFLHGLDFLNSKLDQANIPQERLDWAFDIVRARLQDGEELNRAVWEEKVRWGYLADKLVTDWLEGNASLNRDITDLFGEMGDAKELFEDIMQDGKGVVVASAHIGPMYAGPLALQKIGIKHKWLASTPSVSAMAYDDTLISTSDQSELEVVATAYKALEQGKALIIAVDGALNPAAPTVEFEGKTVTYSEFAARSAFRSEVASVFASPVWNGNKIGFFLERLPEPEEEEDVEDYVVRWNAHFFDVLTEYFVSGPQNLRMSGGIWRNIR
jgi:tetratricopeptide (TPR) repeat protein